MELRRFVRKTIKLASQDLILKMTLYIVHNQICYYFKRRLKVIKHWGNLELDVMYEQFKF